MAKTKPTISKTVRFDPELVTEAEAINPDFSAVVREALEDYVSQRRKVAEDPAKYGSRPKAPPRAHADGAA